MNLKTIFISVKENTAKIKQIVWKINVFSCLNKINLHFSNSFSSQELPDADDNSPGVKPDPADMTLNTRPDDVLKTDSPELPGHGFEGTRRYLKLEKVVNCLKSDLKTF